MSRKEILYILVPGKKCIFPTWRFEMSLCLSEQRTARRVGRSIISLSHFSHILKNANRSSLRQVNEPVHPTPTPSPRRAEI